MVICLEWGADLHMSQLMPLPLTVSCFSKIAIGFTFLVPSHLGSPGCVCVCVCVCVCITCRWSRRSGGRVVIRSADTKADTAALRQPAARTSTRHSQRLHRNRKDLPCSPPGRVHRRKVRTVLFDQFSGTAVAVGVCVSVQTTNFTLNDWPLISDLVVGEVGRGVEPLNCFLNPPGFFYKICVGVNSNPPSSLPQAIRSKHDCITE